MLSIRLLRTGKKNQPFFRLVVTKKTNPPKGGRFLEILGTFNPLTKERKFNAERVKYWLSVGAKPSDTIHNFLIEQKVIEGKKIAVHKKSKKNLPAQTGEEKKEEKPAEVKVETKPEATPAVTT